MKKRSGTQIPPVSAKSRRKTAGARRFHFKLNPYVSQTGYYTVEESGAVPKSKRGRRRVSLPELTFLCSGADDDVRWPDGLRRHRRRRQEAVGRRPQVDAVPLSPAGGRRRAIVDYDSPLPRLSPSPYVSMARIDPPSLAPAMTLVLRSESSGVVVNTVRSLGLRQLRRVATHL